MINNAANILNQETSNQVITENNSIKIPTGVSIESASYIENSNLETNEEVVEHTKSINAEEHTPKLFS